MVCREGVGEMHGCTRSKQGIQRLVGFHESLQVPLPPSLPSASNNNISILMGDGDDSRV